MQNPFCTPILCATSMESAKHSWGPSKVWEMEEQGEFYVWGTGVEISNFIQGNKPPLPTPGRVCGTGEMNGNKPWQTDKIRSSVVDTRRCPWWGPNPQSLDLESSPVWWLKKIVIKNHNKTCNVTLVTYPEVLEFDTQMRLSCDRISMTLELCCLLVGC